MTCVPQLNWSQVFTIVSVRALASAIHLKVILKYCYYAALAIAFALSLKQYSIILKIFLTPYLYIALVVVLSLYLE